MYDVILKNGQIIDGCGNPSYKADIGIKDGKIESIGNLNSVTAQKVFDVSDFVVSPGFIDIHDHSDGGIADDPQAPQKVKQGVTTVLAGNCGSSVAPLTDISRQALKAKDGVNATWTSFKDHTDRLEKKGISVNFASLVGHGTIRSGIMGYEGRAPSDKEQDEMKNMLDQAMQEGAYGLSTGLIYIPGQFSTTEEIVELAKIVAKYDGLYASHIRGHGPQDLDGVREAVEICEKAKVATQVSHIETHLPGSWGREAEMIKIVEDAKERGLDIGFDILTHMCHTGDDLIRLFFQLFLIHPNGLEGFAKDLEKKDYQEKIKKEILESGHLLCSLIALSPEKIETFTPEGKVSVKQLADEAGEDPFHYFCNLAVENHKTGKKMTGLITLHDEEDLRLAVKHPASAIGGDAFIGGNDPRDYGIFPLTIRKYVRGETREEMPEEIGAKILTMEEFIRKCTSLPAQRMELRDRGVVRVGCWADLVVFNPDTISDQGSYEDSAHYPVGIEQVFVNGILVVDKGEHTGTTPGQIIRGPGYK